MTSKAGRVNLLKPHTRARTPAQQPCLRSYHSIQELDAAFQFRSAVTEVPEQKSSDGLPLTQRAVVFLCGPSRRWGRVERWIRCKNSFAEANWRGNMGPSVKIAIWALQPARRHCPTLTPGPSRAFPVGSFRFIPSVFQHKKTPEAAADFHLGPGRMQSGSGSFRRKQM